VKYDRSKFQLEQCHNRRIAVPDFSPLQQATDGEFEYLDKIAGLFCSTNRQAITGIGEAIVVAVDAERARREWEWNVEQAKFDAIVAEERAPLLPTGPTDDIPKWSEVPPDPLPEIHQPE
jgi:hypothetical protein